MLKEEYSVREMEEFLAKNVGVIKGRETTSVFENKVAHYDFIFLSFVEKERIIKLEEELLASSLKLEESEVESFEEIKKNIGKIGLFRHELRGGRNYNLIETPVGFNGRNTYRTYDVTDGNYQALNYIGSPNSEYVYGTFFVINSSFVIASTNSSNIRRAFEVDKCNNSSDIYFCHNVEGSVDVMFSQHVKNKNYVIGNRELSMEEYKKIKESLLEQINSYLKEKKELPFSIWSFSQ